MKTRRAWIRGHRRALLALATTLAIFGAACSSEEPTTESDRGIVEREDVETQDELDEAGLFEQLEGTTTNPDDLISGQCFNEYDYYDRSQTRQQITTTVECQVEHDKELYAVVTHPAADEALFPGQDELLKFARRECLDSFEGFIGEEYVLSALEIGIFQPDYERWIAEDADRTIGCYIYVPGKRLRGSMENIGL